MQKSFGNKIAISQIQRIILNHVNDEINHNIYREYYNEDFLVILHKAKYQTDDAARNEGPFKYYRQINQYFYRADIKVSVDVF
jgi:hypothetical protein